MRARTTNQFPAEVFERASQLVFDQEDEHPSRWAAVVSVAEKAGCSPYALHEWMRGLKRTESAALDAREDRVAEYFGKYGELLRQADVARALESPFVAAVLEAGHRQLRHAPRTAALIADWPGDPASSAMAMRFNAALHALAQRNALPELSALYRDRKGDFDSAIGAALTAEDAFIAEWMQVPPQTNEVGRAATLLSALMVVHGETGGLPFELLEIGSSSGLNLNLAYYSYDMGGILAGMQDSPVRIAPKWLGPPPPFAPVELVDTRGVDLQPLDPSDEAVRERLLSYIWADEPARAERLQQALNMALRYPPQVERDNAVHWLDMQLREPQPAGRCRVVFHSMVLQYLNTDDRRAVTDTIMAAGARATAAQPFAWVSFEWSAMRSEVQLMLTLWPNGGETRQLATCHPYGRWINWLG